MLVAGMGPGNGVDTALSLGIDLSQPKPSPRGDVNARGSGEVAAAALQPDQASVGQKGDGQTNLKEGS